MGNSWNAYIELAEYVVAMIHGYCQNPYERFGLKDSRKQKNGDEYRNAF